MSKIGGEIRACLHYHAEHSESAAKLGQYRARTWMSDGTTVIVEVREPTAASRAAHARHVKKWNALKTGDVR